MVNEETTKFCEESTIVCLISRLIKTYYKNMEKGDEGRQAALGVVDAIVDSAEALAAVRERMR